MSKTITNAVRRGPFSVSLAALMLAMLFGACIGTASAPAADPSLSRVEPLASGTVDKAREKGLLSSLIVIKTPQNGATYARGQRVIADYACMSVFGLTPSECAGPVANGAAIDTNKVGAHKFTVAAKYGSRETEFRSVEYVVTSSGAQPPLSLGKIHQTAGTWREGRAQARISAQRRPRALPIGTTFSFRLNRAAKVSLSFIKHAAGRKVGAKCVAPTPKNRKRGRCTRAVVAGRLTFEGHAGTNRVRFEGVLTHKTLRPGHYTLRAVARALRKRSRTRTALFTIAKH
jgi:hypothetical protein